jgi:cyclic-di-GMP phosphodiesterase, flagellum assembly factor TipF
MSRLIQLFISLCFLVVGACLALALYAATGMDIVESALFGIGLFALLVLAKGRWSDRRVLRSLLDDLEEDRRNLDTTIQKTERTDARLRSMEAAFGKAGGEQAAIEIATLGAMVKDLADALAGQEARLTNLAALAARPASPHAQAATPHATSQQPPSLRPIVAEHAAPAPHAARQAVAAAASEAPVAAALHAAPMPPYDAPAAAMVPDGHPAVPPPQPVAAASQNPRAIDRQLLPPEIVEAVESGRIEVHLQPVVTLPQRKVRLYEASVTLRAHDGRNIAAAEYAPIAAALGRGGTLDGMLVLRCVQIARRLAAKNRELLVACHLSAASLRAPEFLDQVVDLLAGGSGLAGQLVFFMGQAEYQSLRSDEVERLRPLLAAGCRLGIDQVFDLQLDGRALGAGGARFVKVSASVLLDDQASNAQVHIADLSGLLARYGVEMIASDIDEEGVVADLLDFDLKLGQGNLFSPPRPVRPEVLADGPVPHPSAAASAHAPVPAAVSRAAVDAPTRRGASLEPVQRMDRRIAPAADAKPVTLGQVTLLDAVDKLRKVQEEQTGEPQPQERRSAWRILARRVGAREQR